MNIINSISVTIEHRVVLGQVILFLIFFFESLAFVGLVIPGVVFLVIAGILASRDVFDADSLLLIIILAVLLGDIISYYLGKRGKIIFKNNPRILESKFVIKGEEFFEKHGNKSLIFARFIGPIRPLISFVAGILGMKAYRFYIYNFISALLWVAFYFSLGYFFGHAFRLIEIWTSRIGYFIIIIVFFTLVIYALKRFIIRYSEGVYLILRLGLHYLEDWFLGNKYISRLISSFPKTFNFIRSRFRKDVFYGLPLTLLSLAFLYVLFLFGGVVEGVLKLESIVVMDVRIFNLLKSFRSESLVRIFLFITVFGKWYLVVFFSSVSAAIFWLWGKRFYIIPLFTTIIGSAAFAYLGKLAFERQRPPGAVYLESSFSFPSGHATMATAFFGFLAYFFWKNSSSFRMKVNALFANLFFIFLISFSRIYLGVHYFSDIWGGILLGLLWLIIGISIGEWIRFRFGEPEEKKPDLKIKAITFALLTILVIAYLGSAASFKPIFLGSVSPVQNEKIGDPKEIFTGESLPKYSEKLSGKPSVPLNFIFVAKSKEDIIRMFEKSGWFLADKPDIFSARKFLKSFFMARSYSELPQAPSFWNAKIQDMGFEKSATSSSERLNYNIRLWQTDFTAGNGDGIYVASAIFSKTLKIGSLRRRDPDTDRAREYAFKDVNSTGLVSSFDKAGLFLKDEAGSLFSNYKGDGEMYIVYVKSQ